MTPGRAALAGGCLLSLTVDETERQQYERIALGESLSSSAAT